MAEERESTASQPEPPSRIGPFQLAASLHRRGNDSEEGGQKVCCTRWWVERERDNECSSSTDPIHRGETEPSQVGAQFAAVEA